HGIAEYFTAVSGATSLPVVLYDVPARTGRRISPDTVLQLAAEVPNIVGLKDASGDVLGAARIVRDAPGGFELYSGDDALTLALLSVGAVGTICVESHWAGEEVADLVSAFAAGDVARARARNAELIASHIFQSSEQYPNPLPAKAMCRVLGLPAGQCRPPMGRSDAVLEDEARTVLGALGRPTGKVQAPLAAARGGSIG
ncbi:MAG: dihydrodipicolinate synthase family protein, partial [Acidimicrobiales bacterium]